MRVIEPNVFGMSVWPTLSKTTFLGFAWVEESVCSQIITNQKEIVFFLLQSLKSTSFYSHLHRSGCVHT